MEKQVNTENYRGVKGGTEYPKVVYYAGGSKTAHSRAEEQAICGQTFIKPPPPPPKAEPPKYGSASYGSKAKVEPKPKLMFTEIDSAK
jgi:hypothetical protein